MKLPECVSIEETWDGIRTPSRIKLLGVESELVQWIYDCQLDHDLPRYNFNISSFADLDWAKLPGSGKLLFEDVPAKLYFVSESGNVLVDQEDFGELKKIALSITYRELHPNETELNELLARYDVIKAEQANRRKDIKEGKAVIKSFIWNAKKGRWSAYTLNKKGKTVYVLNGKASNNPQAMQTRVKYYCTLGETVTELPRTSDLDAFRMVVVQSWKKHLDLDRRIAELKMAIAQGQP